ncbi:MAG TPA: biotin/lipoyl-containing protein, partial [Acidimicrobiales bacterium]|nr:biotin/lipoyl-containing protein [Acidimicrobiales bacterium]
PPAAIDAMGDKIRAKATVAAAGVPVVPGTADRDDHDDDALAAAVVADVGFPALIKPSAGGGGKGMRLVTAAGDLPLEIAAARREARAGFGDDTLLVERFVRRPRHIELQVFADRHGGAVHLGERECSLQRRHQKVVEEAPSPLLSAAQRSAMGEAAVAAARAVGYVGAGTVEFIVASDRPDDWFFMEMNTRLQVEHPVTEAVTGLDLVEWQLRVAAGEPLPAAQADIGIDGHAIEVRVYAEDPARGFLPAAGPVLALAEPAGAGVRVDSGIVTGSVVGTGFDPMLAKVIAAGPDRATALARLRAALASTAVLGVTTNVGWLTRLLALPEVVVGDLDTELVDRVGAGLAAPPADATDRACVAAAVALAAALEPAEVTDPWQAPGGWRLGAAAETTWRVRVNGEPVELGVTGRAVAGQTVAVRVGGGPPAPVAVEPSGAGRLTVASGGVSTQWKVAAAGDELWLSAAGDTWRVVPDPAALLPAAAAASGGGPVPSPMPGTVLAVHVDAGAAVAAGDRLVTVEAMKMEHVVVAPVAGTVTALAVRAGQAVALDETLAVVTPTPQEEQ